MTDIKQKAIDPDMLRTIIADGARIDAERIDIKHIDGRFRIGIDSLTEPEQRSINGGLFREGFDMDNIEVCEDNVDREKRLPLEKLTEFLAGLHDAPDSQLDKLYADRCADFAKENHTLEKTLEFIRDTRDWCVFTSGASGFMMRVWSILLEEYPEPDAVKKARRAKLDAMVGM